MKIVQSELSTLFTADNASEVIDRLKAGLKAPFVAATVSRLGGPQHTTIMLTVSLDAKDKWSNGILENSRYGKFSISMDGEVSNFSGHGLAKFRKRRVKDVADLVAQINKVLAPAAPKQ